MSSTNYRIIADEPDFIVVDKAPGVHFHSQDGTAGLVAQLEHDLDTKLYSVHRLDTMTSGLLLLARSSAAAAQFTELFTQHQVQKFYLALAQGKPKKKQGWVVGDMAKSRRGMYKLLRSTDNPAITQFFSQSVADGLRLYLLKPLSGKTHQLRVALASLAVPILGDPLYGAADDAERGYLHAYGLQFDWQGQAYRYLCAPTVGEQFVSPAVTQQLADWGEPWQLPWPSKK
ncbi:TIGR01621 family pseudouridine synthase [Shewanella sp. C32]|uniref:TIGR01621 family pseudouridine synthase n=1 Tax=Shewanella electrica TaxID=515560 RepID=A0ABT2FP77_9GAMM|nr:TIGR01621 family pseudouridine synthase [Shewanella electrica]MCH1925948.1 TIGR01621 family pseudouridine synthase [Shewanella electrica]MCS4557445.1 TIGR01621 family pseudouridine synthase [Shewanella electrica]